MPITAIKPLLTELLAEHPAESLLLKRNHLKEYLQIVVLDFIYKHSAYQGLFFYGGSCLAHCYGLPRLSEDLDFVDAGKKVALADLTSDISEYFHKETDLAVKAVRQKFRVYLKFPLLKELNLASASESDLLFLKVEIFSDFAFCSQYRAEIVPLFKFNRSVLIKTFDLPTLFATKLGAVLYRKWEKSDRTGRVIVRAKGRDYFDLMWYLDKGIKPNLACLPEIRDLADLKEKLLVIIDRLDEPSIRLDLEPLIADRVYIERLGKNLKDILRREIQEKL